MMISIFVKRGVMWPEKVIRIVAQNTVFNSVISAVKFFIAEIGDVLCVHSLALVSGVPPSQTHS